MRRYSILIFFGLNLLSNIVFGQTVNELDKKAQEHFEKKEFNLAVKYWLDALEVDPNDERIQKQIEMIYDIKQRKDISIQRAKLNYKIARKYLRMDFTEEDFQTGKRAANKSFSNYISAYRIDPNDSEIKALYDDMRRLESDLKAAEEKQRLTRELLAKIKSLKQRARLEMEPVDKNKNPDYEKALKLWEEVLGLAEKDKDAIEGKRKCKLAIENRIKYERIRTLVASGKDLYKEKKYALAKIEFEQVLKLDDNNNEAKDYIEKIDDKLADVRLKERKRQQAEDFYISGVKNLERYKFDQAQEDFESCLALIPNYKDAKARLNSIDRLRKEYKKRQFEIKLKRINKEFQDGMISLSEGNYKDAIAAFSKTLSLDPENTLAKKYLQRAKDAFKELIETVVTQDSPYYTIVTSLRLSGESLYKKGEYEKSRQKWDRILQLFPKNKIATQYILRCDLKLNPGKYEEFAKRMINEGKELLKKKEYKNALKKFELIKSISPQYTGIDSLIAQAKVITAGRSDGGGIIDVAEVNRRYLLAMGYYQKGGRENYQNALQQLSWIVQRDPDNIKAAISYNKIRTQLKLPTATVATDRVKLTPEQRQLVNKYYYSGINYYSTNDFKRAIQEWRKVLAIDPTHVKAKNNIRKVLVFLNR